MPIGWPADYIISRLSGFILYGKMVYERKNLPFYPIDLLSAM